MGYCLKGINDMQHIFELKGGDPCTLSGLDQPAGFKNDFGRGYAL